jgi:hypothetical protein
MHADYRANCRLPTGLRWPCAFRHKSGMARSIGYESGMGWTARILIAILVLVILGAIGLGVYAGTLKPPHHSYTIEIPNSRFPS